MAGGSEKRSGGRNPADKLTDDILVEILSRTPYKSICRSKCVSRRWHALISHPDHRKKLPQDLAGFFYSCNKVDAHFIYASGTGHPFIHPSLSFLPRCGRLDILDSCNGLLLCRCFKTTDPETFDYVVCSPATEKWVVVPTSRCSNNVQIVCLGFDPAVSSHFHVFEIETTDLGVDGNEDGDEDGNGHVKGVEIYSSETGVWSHKHSGWKPSVFMIFSEFQSVFFNGMLLMVTFEALTATISSGGCGGEDLEDH